MPLEQDPQTLPLTDAQKREAAAKKDFDESKESSLLPAVANTPTNPMPVQAPLPPSGQVLPSMRGKILHGNRTAIVVSVGITAAQEAAKVVLRRNQKPGGPVEIKPYPIQIAEDVRDRVKPDAPNQQSYRQTNWYRTQADVERERHTFK